MEGEGGRITLSRCASSCLIVIHCYLNCFIVRKVEEWERKFRITTNVLHSSLPSAMYS